MKFDSRATLKSQDGQLAIFAAIMFQILFVFFAMAINVSLIVHDKINLQNSADLAAYYGAAKQAEILNAIAHVNYQIRQAYKLYAWRYRVVGTLGLEPPVGVGDPRYFHPSDYRGTERTETEWRWGAVEADANSGKVFPQVCIRYQPSWLDAPNKENACKTPNLKIPAIPKIAVIAGFVPINFVISQFSSNLRTSFDNSCAGQGVWNWWFVHAIKMSYRLDQANRRRLINALAANLGRSAEEIRDLDGASIFAGVQQTALKNLTWGNANSVQPPEVRWINSMAGVTRQQWLEPIFIAPEMAWTDLIGGGDAGCNSVPKYFGNLPDTSRAGSAETMNFINLNLGGDELRKDEDSRWGETDDALRLSIGYEKNPWYMVYSGVEIKALSRNIFHPFGDPVFITARAYAKPFGGRIGPWYKPMWPPNATQSSGNQKVDLRGQPRTLPDGNLDNFRDPDRFPNYSRFPGDELGLASRLAQAGINRLRNDIKTRKEYYYNIYQRYEPNRAHDPLAWDVQANRIPDNTREMELAAIIPDLFDISYYSVEPNFWGNYGARIEARRSELGIPDNLVIRPDLGYRAGQDNFRSFSVQNQLGSIRFLNKEAFYFVRDRKHFLTGWIPGPGANVYVPSEEGGAMGANDPAFPFGDCKTFDNSFDPNNNGKVPNNPGSCIVGGRTGYSVKIVARDYLTSREFTVGGPNAGTGPIKNPPQ